MIEYSIFYINKKNDVLRDSFIIRAYAKTKIILLVE